MKIAIGLILIVTALIVGFVVVQGISYRKGEFPKVVVTPWCGSYTPVAEMPLISTEDLLNVNSL